MSRFVVTGTGRCGTASVAQALRNYGLDVTHQGISHRDALAGPQTVDGRQYLRAFKRPVGRDGDVSFEAAPLAPYVRGPLVLLVRDPAKVVQSWLKLGAFTNRMPRTHGDWWESLATYTTVTRAIADPDVPPWVAGLRFYLEWNELVMPHADHVLNIETLTVGDLLDAVGHPGAAASLYRTKLGREDWGTPDRDPTLSTGARVDTIRAVVADRLGPHFNYPLRQGIRT